MRYNQVLLQRNFEPFIREEARKHYVPSALQTIDEFEEQMVQKANDSLGIWYTNIENAIKYLSEKEIALFSEEWESFIDSPKWQAVQEGKERISLKELFRINEETFLQIYEEGYRLYQKNEYPTARDLFFLCVNLEPRSSSLWLALARAEEIHMHWDQAIFAYLMAYQTSEFSQEPLFEAIDLLEKIDDPLRAIHVLEDVIGYHEKRGDTVDLAPLNKRLHELQNL